MDKGLISDPVTSALEKWNAKKLYMDAATLLKWLWWDVTFTVKNSVSKVWAEGWVVEGTVRPKQWAAETFFLKRLHAGHSDDNSRDTAVTSDFSWGPCNIIK